MPTARFTLPIVAAGVLAACSEPPPPRSVDEFLQNPILLEAALVRCAQNRSEMRYETECVNAREANEQIAAREEAERREEFERQSQRKRQALRRAQEAAATARRRAEEERRRREEAEYLLQFGHTPPDAEQAGEDVAGGNEPVVVVPEQADPSQDNPGFGDSTDEPPDSAAEVDAPTDLEAVREELRHRNDE